VDELLEGFEDYNDGGSSDLIDKVAEEYLKGVDIADGE